MSFWAFGFLPKQRKKCIHKKVSITGTGSRVVAVRQWMVINGTFNTIDDKVMDLIISYFGFTSLAQRLQNMNNDPFTI